MMSCPNPRVAETLEGEPPEITPALATLSPWRRTERTAGARQGLLRGLLRAGEEIHPGLPEWQPHKAAFATTLFKDKIEQLGR
jgi:hypothetical protein